MVSVAAGLARGGLRPWVYSIAPFLYARPFEQIRNDVCLHGLPVVLVGNGGGYGYGVMGATHHALEDYGALLSLPHMPRTCRRSPRTSAPRSARIAAGTGRRTCASAATRSRKGVDAAGLRALAAAARRAAGPSMVIVGPLAGGIIEALLPAPEASRPSVWVLTELPVDASLPSAFLDDLRRSGHLFVVEEHVAQGGAGRCSPTLLARRGARARAVQPPLGAGLSLGAVRVAEVPPQGVRPGPGQHRRRSCRGAATRPCDRTANADVASKIRDLQGPILVLGASGFVGRQPDALAAAHRAATSTARSSTRPPGGWTGCPTRTSSQADLLVDSNLDAAARARSSRAPSSTASPTAPTRSRPTAS